MTSSAAKPTRVYLVGAHSTGKTTLARYVRDHLGLPMISEVARSVLAELELTLDTLRADINAVERYQTEVFRRQIEMERRMRTGFVSDRAFCNLAYAAQHTLALSKLVQLPEFSQYMEWVSEGLIFFVRPHPELVREDGVRAGVNYEEILRIDGMVKLMLEMHGMAYVPIESLNMQERVRTLETVVGMRLRLHDLEAAPVANAKKRNGRSVAAEPLAVE